MFLTFLTYHFQTRESRCSNFASVVRIYYDNNTRCNVKCDDDKQSMLVEHQLSSSDIPISKLPDFGKFEENQYDYPNITYPIPFNYLYNDISCRYENYGKVNPKLPSFVLTGDIPSVDNRNSDVLVMTGASDNHGHGSFNLVYSALLTDPHASIIYIDLGLSEEFLTYLKAHFETWRQIQMKMRSNGFLAYRRINWKNFPEWMNISNRLTRGGYSFKPIAIFDGFTQWRGLFTWLDAGNVIIDTFSREFTYARRYGYYAPVSPGVIEEWTHPGMISFFESHGLIKKVNKRDSNCSSGIMFYDWSKEYTHEMVRLFADCAYTSRCISPLNATKANHRFDQALASLLIHHYNIPRSAEANHSFHPALRNEGPTYYRILQNLIVAFRHTYHIDLNNTKYDFSSFKYSKVRYGYIRRNVDF